MYVFYNPNPLNQFNDDCVVRALCKVTGLEWDTVYGDLVDLGFLVKNMPSANSVWGKYLKQLGFKRFVLPDTCPDCYTVKRFCYEHPFGKYVVATGTHVVAVINGNYYDSADSGNEILIYYWKESK